MLADFLGLERLACLRVEEHIGVVREHCHQTIPHHTQESSAQSIQPLWQVNTHRDKRFPATRFEVLEVQVQNILSTLNIRQTVARAVLGVAAAGVGAWATVPGPSDTANTCTQQDLQVQQSQRLDSTDHSCWSVGASNEVQNAMHCASKH